MNTTSQNINIKVTGRGVGQVRTESYNKKGKLMSVNELVELSGY